MTIIIPRIGKLFHYLLPKLNVSVFCSRPSSSSLVSIIVCQKEKSFFPSLIRNKFSISFFLSFLLKVFLGENRIRSTSHRLLATLYSSGPELNSFTNIHSTQNLWKMKRKGNPQRRNNGQTFLSRNLMLIDKSHLEDVFLYIMYVTCSRSCTEVFFSLFFEVGGFG